MKGFHRKLGAIAAVALLASSCAVRQPIATLPPEAPALDQRTPGVLTVPVTLPSLGGPQVQYVYDRNSLNTVEVRLRDAMGNEAVQYVVRNAYLTGSHASGTVNVIFHNVMPGTFTLTVRSSHARMLSASGPVKYDGLRDVFFIDADNDHAFDPSEEEIPVISKSGATVANSNFLVFPLHPDMPGWIFPDALRMDASALKAGFGIGGATASIAPGESNQIGVTVGQAPQWDLTLPSTEREVTAGESLTLAVTDPLALQATESVAVIDPSVTVTGGVVKSADFIASKLDVYATAIDPVAGTLTFTPTRASHPSSSAAPTAWPFWIARGQAVSEVGLSASTAPKLTVLPALVSEGMSRIFGKTSHVPSGSSSEIQFDLRDAWNNRVAGNVDNVNKVGLATLRRANAGLSMDYAVHAWRVGDGGDAGPFILPGRTTGTVNAQGVYTQGTTAPLPAPKPPTYTAVQANAAPSDLKLKRLEVPYHVYASSQGSFAPGAHEYELTMPADPVRGNPWVWLTFQRRGGPVIASASVDASANLGDIALKVVEAPANASPPPLMPQREEVVVISVPNRPLISANDNGARFNVTDYGARGVEDTDTVRARVLRNGTPLFTKDVTFGW